MSAQVVSVTSVFSQKMELNDQVSGVSTSCTWALLDKTVADEGKISLVFLLPLPGLAGKAIRFLAGFLFVCLFSPCHSCFIAL